MVLHIDSAGRFLGRVVTDQYGTSVGKIVGISTDVKGVVTSIELELGNGRFMNCPSDQIEISGDRAIFLDAWRVKAENLKAEIGVLLRRMRALSDLHRRGEIQPEIYEDLRKQHDINLADLQRRRDTLVKDLSAVSDDLDRQLRELEVFLANNKMQLASAEIDGQAYKIAVDALERGLHRVLSSKKDVESLMTNLQGLRWDTRERLPENEPHSLEKPFSYESIAPVRTQIGGAEPLA